MSTHGDGRPPPESVIERDRIFDQILNIYRRHFDITLNHTLLGMEIPAFAHFYARGERYVLSKHAKLWGVENNEYVLFFKKNLLDAQEFRKITDFLEAAEAELVKPHSEHMYTYLSTVVLAEALTDEMKAIIRRYKWRKNYLFTIHGWCNIRVAVVDLSNGTVLTNRDGREMKKALNQALEPS